MQEFSVPASSAQVKNRDFPCSDFRMCKWGKAMPPHVPAVFSPLPHLRFLESSSDFTALHWCLGIKSSTFTWDSWCFGAVLCQVFHGLSVKSLTVFCSLKRGNVLLLVLLQPCWNVFEFLPGTEWELHQPARTLVFIQNSWVHVKHCQKRTFLSSAKLTAPLSISTPCAWEIKTHDCLFFFSAK